MAYDCQRELDSLIQQCDDMEESINAAGILALNYIDDPAEVYNNSSVNIQITDERWIKLCQDFDTFFRINPDEMYLNFTINRLNGSSTCNFLTYSSF